VETAIVRALAKDPAERYGTAAEFADALAGRETAAAPDTNLAAKKGCAAILLLAAGVAGMATLLQGLV
jgi:hypothetical protein